MTDLGIKSNLLGALIAALSVVSSTMQQIFCRTMQQRNNLAFLEFLSHTAPAQVHQEYKLHDVLTSMASRRMLDANQSRSDPLFCRVLSCFDIMWRNRTCYR